MVAAHDGEQSPRIGKGALFDLLDPRAVYPQRHIMLRLASHCTGMAPDAFSVVDDKSVAHKQAVSGEGLNGSWRAVSGANNLSGHVPP